MKGLEKVTSPPAFREQNGTTLKKENKVYSIHSITTVNGEHSNPTEHVGCQNSLVQTNVKGVVCMRVIKGIPDGMLRYILLILK